MGSVVISAAASDIGQYNSAQRPMMIGPVSQQHVATDQSANSSTNNEQSSTASAAFASSASCPAPPAPRNAPTVTPSLLSGQEPSMSAQAMSETISSAQAADRARLVHHFNPYTQGFDQSGFPLTSAPRALAASSPSSPRLLPTYRSTRSLGGSEGTSPSRIKVRDLSHIQSFASEEVLAKPPLAHGPGSQFTDPSRQYEISAMPVTDIIEMVAGLLTKITTTNDQQHDHVHNPTSPSQNGAPSSSQTTSVLAFHGRNVPTITILSYLSRIHKYCPTTYEVFLSLLVYFDRMTEAVNRGFLERMRRDTAQGPAVTAHLPQPSPSISTSVEEHVTEGSHSGTGSVGPEDSANHSGPISSCERFPGSHGDLSRFFVVDSYNIHRLVIAGVTCASKFFSDVFYTNSRYAKVGGLGLTELNHLELQFLLLNDFRLSIPVEELEAYGTLLVEFYAREVVKQQQHAAQQHAQHLASSHNSTDGVYFRDQSAVPCSAQAATPS